MRRIGHPAQRVRSFWRSRSTGTMAAAFSVSDSRRLVSSAIRSSPALAVPFHVAHRGLGHQPGTLALQGAPPVLQIPPLGGAPRRLFPASDQSPSE